MTPPPPADQFASRVARSLADASFVRLVLSQPGPDAQPVRRIEGRLIVLREAPTLSLTLQEPARDSVRNLPAAEAADWVRGQVGGRFAAAWLETTRRDWQLSAPVGRPARLIAHPPRTTAPPARTHDQPRQTALSASADDWLRALGVLDASSRPRPGKADKLTQILRFAEILGHLVQECGWAPGASLAVADMGCGKGYLTFAAWQLLRREMGLAPEVLGVDHRPNLAGEAGAIASRLGLEGLRFAAGSIADVPLARLDILLALHACDTATDDALRRGIEGDCRLLVVAPCCHQELRPQLGCPEPLAPVLRHGLMAGRMAEWLTDGLRALFLEWAGYRVKLIEFVASEHTPKNLLLAATRAGAPFENRAARERIVALKQFFGVAHHALDPWLDR